MFVHQLVISQKQSSGGTYATWNPADKTVGLALTGSNLIATSSGAGEAARSTLSKSSGKWYWEYSIGSASGITSLGVGLSGSTLGSQLGAANSGVGYIGSSGDIDYNSTFIGNFSSYSAGAVIGIALDATGHTVGFYRNNVLQSTVTGLAAGSWFAQCFLDTTNSITANFGATALTYSPPAGFNAGLYV